MWTTLCSVFTSNSPNERGLEDEAREAGDDVHRTEDGRDGSSHTHDCVNLQRVLRPLKAEACP